MHRYRHDKDIFKYTQFLCKNSRVKWVPVFDGHFVHDQISDLKHLCFYLFINNQIKVWICYF